MRLPPPTHTRHQNIFSLCGARYSIFRWYIRVVYFPKFQQIQILSNTRCRVFVFLKQKPYFSISFALTSPSSVYWLGIETSTLLRYRFVALGAVISLTSHFTLPHLHIRKFVPTTRVTEFSHSRSCFARHSPGFPFTVSRRTWKFAQLRRRPLGTCYL